MGNRDSLLKQIEAKEKEWGDQVKNLQSKAAGFDVETRIKFEEQIRSLNKKLKVIELHTEGFKNHNNEVWNDFGGNIALAWGELVRTVDNAFLKLKNK